MPPGGKRGDKRGAMEDLEEQLMAKLKEVCEQRERGVARGWLNRRG